MDRLVAPPASPAPPAAPVAPVVRLAGLPATLLDGLRTVDTARAVDEHLALGDWLAAEGGALGDLLHEVIGRLAPGDPGRPALVGLRRALHGRRAPGPREWGDGSAALVPDDVAARVGVWIARRAAWRRGEAEIALALAAETDRVPARLREIVAAPNFRRALWHSSPALSAELDRWLADESRTPRHQSITALTRYAVRAATKTSPYGTFMVSGTGEWTRDGAPLTVTGDPWHSAHCVTELFDQVSADLVAARLSDPAVRETTPVLATPAWTRDGDVLRYVGSPPEEPVVRVEETPALRACLRAAAEPVPLARLRDRLAATGGAPPEKVVAFLDRLLAVGLLRYVPSVEPAGAETAVADLAGHRSRHRDLRERVALRGVTVRGAGREHAGVALETAVSHRPLAGLALTAWQPVLDDLQAVRAWLSLFDLGLGARLAMAEWARGALPGGGPVPFITFYRAVAEETRSGSPAGRALRSLLSARASDQDHQAFPVIEQLDGLRMKEIAEVAGAGRVEPGVLAAAAARRPGWAGRLHSIGVYGQLLPGGGATEFAVNAVDIGFGRGRARVGHLVRTGGGRWPGQGRSRLDDGPAFAGFGGTFGFSLNERLPSLPYELDYPFGTVPRPGVVRLPLRDLLVTREEESGRLRLSHPAGPDDIRVLHLGMCATSILPPVARVLLGAFGEQAPLTPARLAPSEPVPGSPTRVVPRLTAGHVVVWRARWESPAGEVPARTRGESDAAYLVRLTAWRRRHGLPDRCFVRASSRRRAPGNTEKPFYIDFRSWPLVQVFESLLRRATGTVAFEEALPDPATTAGSEGTRQVAEVLLEISDPRMRHE
ncbi:lantibiotic dehydratase [Nonomuraea sp. B10E15]|uniref:lantibiotic dehydratase n=1 Tax=Nonomuraea sp. B10E15 TaxID=3153560 RepID=UPI00325F7D6A